MVVAAAEAREGVRRCDRAAKPPRPSHRQDRRAGPPLACSREPNRMCRLIPGGSAGPVSRSGMWRMRSR
jgi:hypothetical protein